MSEPNTLGEFSLNSTPIPASDLEAERLTRKREAALGYRIMASWGWGADGSGHITARDPEHTDCFWLLAYGIPFDQGERDRLAWHSQQQPFLLWLRDLVQIHPLLPLLLPLWTQ